MEKRASLVRNHEVPRDGMGVSKQRLGNLKK